MRRRALIILGELEHLLEEKWFVYAPARSEILRTCSKFMLDVDFCVCDL